MSKDVDQQDKNSIEEEESLRKLEREGYLFFQRCGESEWEDVNSFYAYSSHEHSIVNANQEDSENTFVSLEELDEEIPYEGYDPEDEDFEEDL